MQNFITNEKRPKHSQIIRIIEGFETLEFRSHFDNWPLHEQYPISEEGRGKVAGKQCIMRVLFLNPAVLVRCTNCVLTADLDKYQSKKECYV